VLFSIVLSDNLNTEGSRNCTVWQAFFGGLIGVVVLGLITQWRRIKLRYHSSSQPDGGSYELPSAHNNKEHYAQNRDAVHEETELGIDGTNGLSWDDEVMPQEL